MERRILSSESSKRFSRVIRNIALVGGMTTSLASATPLSEAVTIHPPLVNRTEHTTAYADHCNYAVLPKDRFGRPILPRTVGTLTVPKLGLANAPITPTPNIDCVWPGTHRISWLNYSAKPDQHGGMILDAHDDIEGNAFRYLATLKPGDAYQINTNHKTYLYQIDHPGKLVLPNDTQIFNDKRNISHGYLVSCYPFDVDSTRVVEQSRLIKIYPDPKPNANYVWK